MDATAGPERHDLERSTSRVLAERITMAVAGTSRSGRGQDLVTRFRRTNDGAVR